MMKKFELVQDMSIYLFDRKIYRIRALKDFTTIDGITVRVGDLGGYVEKEENLRHKGNAWVGGYAIVIGNAIVGDNAVVKDNTVVRDNAWVGGNAVVEDRATVKDTAIVIDNAVIKYNAVVEDHAAVKDIAVIKGNARVGGSAVVKGNAEIYKKSHILTINPIGSRDATTTFFRDKDNEITVSCGCFLGKIDAFLEKVEETHGDNKHGKAYRLTAELAKIQIDLEE